MVVNDTTNWSSTISGWKPVRSPVPSISASRSARTAPASDCSEMATSIGNWIVAVLAYLERGSATGCQLGQLDFGERSHVRRIEQAVDMVEPVSIDPIGHDEIDEHHPPVTATHSSHLADRSLGRREVMQRATAEHDVERLVHEGQLFGITLLEQHVADARVAQTLGPHAQERGGQVDTDDLVHGRGERLGGVGRAAGHVEQDHVGCQWLDPRRGARRPRRER